MNVNKKINALAALGQYIQDQETSLQQIIDTTSNENAWFTPENTLMALDGLAYMLEEKKLNTWLGKYSLTSISPKNIGIIMAGNIPLVGFHDLLTVVISGNNALVKLSSQDSLLITHLVEKLIEIEAEFDNHIQFITKLDCIDAIIATGSDNSSRYFEYYFAKYPNVIRKNRTSCAILNGSESKDEIQKLGNDIFQYFGLGCRNVSKLYLPSDYKIPDLLDGLNGFSEVINHHKYHNNYDYNKSIFLVNKVQHYDNGFLLLTENPTLVSPLAVLYFEHYNSKAELDNMMGAYKDKLQCIVSLDSWYPGSVPFGKAQRPELWDYADNVDTLQFLISLN